MSGAGHNLFVSLDALLRAPTSRSRSDWRGRGFSRWTAHPRLDLVSHLDGLTCGDRTSVPRSWDGVCRRRGPETMAGGAGGRTNHLS
jgi:hypothetical protein